MLCTPTAESAAAAVGQASGKEIWQGIADRHEEHSKHRLTIGRRIAVQHLLRHHRCSMDDVRAAMEIPAREDARYLGALFRPLKNRKICKIVENVQSQRPAAHARRVLVYQLVDGAEAQKFLTETAPKPAPAAPPTDQRGHYLLFNPPHENEKRDERGTPTLIPDGQKYVI